MTKQLLIDRKGDAGYSITIAHFQQGVSLHSEADGTKDSMIVLSGHFTVEHEGKSRQLCANSFWQLPQGVNWNVRCLEGPGSALLISAPSASEAAEPDEWLQKMYEIAWSQYTHEDDMGQKRDSIFAAINAALIAALAVISPWLWRAGPVHMFQRQIHLGLTLLGLLTVCLGALSIQLNSHWRSITRAGNAYLKLRWAVARAIEVYLKLRPIGLADMENQWKVYSSRENAEDSFNPYPDLFEEKGLSLAPRPQVSGWSSVLHIAKILMIMWWIILTLGVGLIVTSILEGLL
ncbi:hypothetical protein [Streptomyces sp. NPDC001348]